MLRKKRILKQLVEIRDKLLELEEQKRKLRDELFMLMKTNETVYGKQDIAEKVEQEEVVLHSKEKIFEILGEDKYIELSFIGINSLRGNVSDRKLKKLVKRVFNKPVLKVRRLS